MGGEEASLALERLDQLQARWVDLQFLDLAGVLRRVTVSRRLIDEGVMREGIGKLDGSSVKGFVEINESDLRLKPIPGTLALLPWGEGVARFLCTIHRADGSRFERDPRLPLEAAVEALGAEGYTALMSFELEFFVFDDFEARASSYESYVRIETLEPDMGVARKEAYYVSQHADSTYEYALRLAEVLEGNFAVPVEVFHHEVASGGQMEVNFQASDPLTAADRLATIKYAARNVAVEQGRVAVFLPKPIPDDNGSGLHTHISLWRGGSNAFYDPDDPYAELSQTARYFIGGLLEHARALAAFTNPTVNSYRRLIPGYEAPVYLVWSKANRSAAVRVPFYRRGEPHRRRIEYRPPDPTVNPYLAAAAMLLAGFDGVKRKIDPGDPVDENVYRMTPERRRALGVRELPRSLEEALDELESDSEWLRPAFPKSLIEAYIDLKRGESRTLAAYASAAEMLYYLNY
ncbi:MAG: type I glutamate--ammonia ligase [Desulfurococcales archaeon]|nr:type I glutamate--ammonia ligase [Desulfurococcales archaeon]